MHTKPTQHSNEVRMNQFHAFLENYPLHSTTLNTIRWQYRDCGQGPETILLLPGAPGLSFTSFQDILFFERDFRLLVPDYPAQACTLLLLVEGLAALLEEHQLNQVHLVGGSYGGLLAQAFVARYPDRVSRFVLSHSGLPRKKRAYLLNVLTGLLIFLPECFIQYATHSALPVFMRSFPDQQGLWYTCFRQVLDTLQKADYLARLRVHDDFDRHMTLSHITLSPWHGQTFLIEADDDPYTTTDERTQMKQLYPQAKVHTFHETAHYVWASDPVPYFSMIRSFLLS